MSRSETNLLVAAVLWILEEIYTLVCTFSLFFPDLMVQGNSLMQDYELHVIVFFDYVIILGQHRSSYNCP